MGAKAQEGGAAGVGFMIAKMQESGAAGVSFMIAKAQEISPTTNRNLHECEVAQ